MNASATTCTGHTALPDGLAAMCCRLSFQSQNEVMSFEKGAKVSSLFRTTNVSFERN